MSVPTQIIVNRQAPIPAVDAPVGPTRWDDAASAYPAAIKQGVRNAFDAAYRDVSDLTQLAVDDATALGAALTGAYAYLHPALGMGLAADGTTATKGSESPALAKVYSLSTNKLRVDQATANARPVRVMVGKRPVMDFAVAPVESASMTGALPVINGGVHNAFDVFLNVNYTGVNGRILTLLNNAATGTNAEFVIVTLGTDGKMQLAIRTPPTSSAVVSSLTAASVTALPTGWGTLNARINFANEVVDGMPANSAALYWIAPDGTVAAIIPPTTLASAAGAPGSVSSLSVRIGGNAGSRRARAQLCQVLLRGDLAQNASARAGMTATLPTP